MVLRKSDVTFHSGEVRFFSEAEIEAQTCTDAREAIAAISDNFGSSKNQGQNNFNGFLTKSLCVLPT